MHRPLRFAVLLLAAAPAAQENLELGKMWRLEQPPLAYLQQEYGFAPGEDWFRRLQLAALRFGDGCSASFISPKGLIMTNHHCVEGYLAQVSPDETDYVKAGFVAKEAKEELAVPGLTVQQLVATADVTAQIEQGVVAAMSAAEKQLRRNKNGEEVLAAAKKARPDLEPQLVKLYSGAIWMLYSHKIWDDVRIVCAPQVATAFFGGDYDNFCYPRYCTDFSFCRAYENGEPADTSAHWYRFKTEGPKDGELVFVPGNPGETNRLLTKAQLEFHRDADLPITIEFLQSQLDVLRPAADSSDELARLLRSDIFQLENSLKALRGELAGLHDAALMAQKEQAEAAFRARIAKQPELQQEYGAIWPRLAEIAAERTKLAPKLRFYAPGPSRELSIAVVLVRSLDEKTPAEQREQAREQLGQLAALGNPMFERLFLVHLRSAIHRLGREDPFVRALAGDLEPEAAAARLKQSKVRDEQFVADLQSGKIPLDRADDVAIAAARVLVAAVDAIHARAEALQTEEEELNAAIGRALFAAYGTQVSPDATFTLRFSDGRVQGYPYNGTLAPWRTTFHGLYARHAEFDGKDPFALPQVWLEREDRIAMTQGLNFVSTNDIIGGNSGSAVVNDRLEVVGLVFDGNVESLPNRFLWRLGSGRSVSVHPQGIVETLRKILDAGRIADELEGR